MPSLRTLQSKHSQYETATQALGLLPTQGWELHIVPQDLVEMWEVATRPVDQNGLGLSPAATAEQINRIKGMFRLLPENPALYQTWESLVIEHEVSGKLVPWNRDDLHKSRSAAPGWQGAKSELIGHK